MGSWESLVQLAKFFKVEHEVQPKQIVAVETGLQDESIRAKIRPFLKGRTVTAEVLMQQMGVAVSAEKERDKKLRLPWTFAGVLGEKIRMRATLKKNGKLYIVGKLNKCRFQKKINNCQFLQFRKRKSQTTVKMTMCHSFELIGYQIRAHWQNNCTVLITKDQSSKVCQHFSIFSLVIYKLICQVRAAKNAQWALN